MLLQYCRSYIIDGNIIMIYRDLRPSGDIFVLSTLLYDYLPFHLITN